MYSLCNNLGHISVICPVYPGQEPNKSYCSNCMKKNSLKLYHPSSQCVNSPKKLKPLTHDSNSSEYERKTSLNNRKSNIDKPNRILNLSCRIWKGLSRWNNDWGEK